MKCRCYGGAKCCGCAAFFAFYPSVPLSFLHSVSFPLILHIFPYLSIIFISLFYHSVFFSTPRSFCSHLMKVSNGSPESQRRDPSQVQRHQHCSSPSSKATNDATSSKQQQATNGCFGCGQVRQRKRNPEITKKIQVLRNEANNPPVISAVKVVKTWQKPRVKGWMPCAVTSSARHSMLHAVLHPT